MNKITKIYEKKQETRDKNKPTILLKKKQKHIKY